jgi:hypothetical protein
MDNQFLDESLMTVSSVDSSYPVSNMLDPVRSRVFKPTTNTFTIEVDLQYNANINFIGVVGPLSRSFGISEVATITLEANNIDDFTLPPFSQTLTPTTSGILTFLDGDTAYRYWKLSIDDSTNPVDVEIGYLYLGDLTQLTDRTVNKGFTAGVVDPTKSATSMNGTLFFDEKQKYHRFNGLGLGYLSGDDRKTIEDLYYRIGKGNPFFISIDPNLKISDEQAELTKLVVFENAPGVAHKFDNKYSLSFSLREVV